MSDSKPQYNTARDLLKVIAIIAMTADHVSTVFLAEGTVLYNTCQFFGNFTIVIMCFFIVQGLKHTRSVLNYSQRLLGWALVSEAPFYLLFGMRLDVMFTPVDHLPSGQKGVGICDNSTRTVLSFVSHMRLEHHRSCFYCNLLRAG